MRWRNTSWALMLWMAAPVVPLTVLALHTGWLYTELWLLGPFALVAAVYAYAGLCSPALAVVATRDRPSALAAACLLLVAGVAVPVVLALAPDLRARARFHLERSAFDSVVELAARGGLAAGDYYGAPLPGRLCFVSATCRVVTWAGVDGRPVLFVPDRVGVPDDAVGYGYFAGVARGSYDGFGLRVCPRFPLADGWWWLDACAGPD